MHSRLNLTEADHGRGMSWEEFSSADTELGFRYELIEGKVYVTPFPSLSHESFRDWLRELLNAFAVERPDLLARVKTIPVVFVPNPNGPTITRPDIACYAKFAARFARNAQWRDYSPILVVEVLSNDDLEKDLIRNRRLYLQTPSIQEYWILDPRKGVEGLTLLVFRRRGNRWGTTASRAGRCDLHHPLAAGIFALARSPGGASPVKCPPPACNAC